MKLTVKREHDLGLNDVKLDWYLVCQDHEVLFDRFDIMTDEAVDLVHLLYPSLNYDDIREAYLTCFPEPPSQTVKKDKEIIKQHWFKNLKRFKKFFNKLEQIEQKINITTWLKEKSISINIPK